MMDPARPSTPSHIEALLDGTLPGELLARVREKHFDKWLPAYLRHAARQTLEKAAIGARHLLFALCDHFEPLWKRPTAEVARARVQRWVEGYPRLAADFRDADGRPPRHSFFFPGEEYAPEYLAGLAELAGKGLGEVELHLHHDGDTEETLRSQITDALGRFAEHGHLARRDGRLRYAFIHGNWCLANARRDGRWCGVDAELPLLFQTGCYADFTFPAVPDESQPAVVNEIYWPWGDLRRRRAHEEGRRARVGEIFPDRLLMIEGPLAVRLRPAAPFVSIENADITGTNPPAPERVHSWVAQNIHVQDRPEWVFVKVHTHGTQEANADALLGNGARSLHQTLAAHYNDGKQWFLHYVTAREMYNIAMAAMAGRSGNPGEFRDYHLKPPPIVGG
jgi:hypothetical protein